LAQIGCLAGEHVGLKAFGAVTETTDMGDANAAVLHD